MRFEYVFQIIGFTVQKVISMFSVRFIGSLTYWQFFIAVSVCGLIFSLLGILFNLRSPTRFHREDNKNQDNGGED